jgi:hypothetical protein
MSNSAPISLSIYPRLGQPQREFDHDFIVAAFDDSCRLKSFHCSIKSNHPEIN